MPPNTVRTYPSTGKAASVCSRLHGLAPLFRRLITLWAFIDDSLLLCLESSLARYLTQAFCFPSVIGNPCQYAVDVRPGR